MSPERLEQHDPDLPHQITEYRLCPDRRVLARRLACEFDECGLPAGPGKSADLIKRRERGTILPCQVFGRHMAEHAEGVILNISSMNAFRPLTRIPAYSAAKAAVSNFTQWLAVHMAQNYSPRIRVNAIAPGFFITDQNRFLLTDKDSGDLTAPGKSVIAHTPMNRFGTPEGLLGATMWLISPAAAFVTGAVIPIDGGFSAFSGV